ncbi:hypothetical protein [Rhodococcus sp. NPDC058514]|uniref:hypothetical protein n=1 Tax=unclassified Rhodococcus (in: high G+C Gram-positive bacteria) TaxID=192944 RepID=UPI003662FAA3
MSNTIKRTFAALALSAAALGAGAGVASAGIFDHAFNVGVGGPQVLSPGAGQIVNPGGCIVVGFC